MKPNIPEPRAKTDWSPVTRGVLVPVAWTLGLALLAFLIIASKPLRAIPVSKPVPTRVLMVGDSLTVGQFGEVIGNYLVKKYHEENVWLYASCGSSPENWLPDEPVFRTRCGCRQMTPHRPLIFGDPRHYTTPKLNQILAESQPTVVIVQQGTNWMDRSLSDDQIRQFIDRFIGTLHHKTRKIIWIGPPDSLRFRRVQDRIYRLVRQAGRKHGVDVINSVAVTGYVRGKTGGDGIHYNKESSALWANRVIPQLDNLLPNASPRTTRRRLASADE